MAAAGVVRVGVVGGGALGCLVAERVARCGRAAVTIVRREDGSRSLERARTLRVRELAATSRGAPHAAAEVRVAQVDVAHGLCALRAPLDVVLVTVKRRDAAELDKQLADALDAGLLRGETAVLSLQNGMGEPGELSAGGRLPVVAGLTYNGATLLEPLFAQHNAAGATIVGMAGAAGEDLPPRVRELVAAVDAITDAAEPWTLTDNIESVQWTKLLANTVINSMTAVLNLENWVVGEPRMRGIVTSACREFEAVARAEGVKLALGDCASAEEFVLGVTDAVRLNTSSMLADLRRGRPTEVDAITGFVVRRAAAHGVDVPVLTGLWRLVQALESSPFVDTAGSPAAAP